MNHDSKADDDLLARLNALKKSTVELNSTSTSNAPLRGLSVDPAPARALHADLLNRFKSLSGKDREADSTRASTDRGISDDTIRHEDDLTVEELLAGLGPAEQWDINKTEHDEVEDLLKSANTALGSKPTLETVPGDDDADSKPAPRSEYALPSVDITAFQPEPESDVEPGGTLSKQEIRDAVNSEADEVLRRLMDEVEYEKKHQPPEDSDSDADGVHTRDPTARPATSSEPPPNLDLPSTPAKDPEPPPEDDLAARFASLTLPSVPTTISKPASTTSAKKPPAFSDEEIDSWCIICNDDATLSCLGCDEDLYCTNCWLEGHRGEDAGADKRRHRAVQYNKRRKNTKASRSLVGAA